ncbi:S-layer homology domain-containing protein [Lysinibacillus macroides]|uniref:Ig-like domain-containing protein n=1 Tax=Lysinibacillus macroides TaxID=33935 RepID=UPI0006B533B1|nr:Ig-like domain-containing protein [Lysinibacillus macroides]QPR69333.1 S-layer homology domain-containing protein [Lysinibacillus macroides]
MHSNKISINIFLTILLMFSLFPVMPPHAAAAPILLAPIDGRNSLDLGQTANYGYMNGRAGEYSATAFQFGGIDTNQPITSACFTFVGAAAGYEVTNLKIALADDNWLTGQLPAPVLSENAYDAISPHVLNRNNYNPVDKTYMSRSLMMPSSKIGVDGLIPFLLSIDSFQDTYIMEPKREIEYVASLVNTAPVLTGIGNRTVNEGSFLTFTASASDAEGDSLTYSLVGAPAGATINATTGVFTWTPTEAQGPGSYPFIIRVSDDALTDEEEITVTVNEVNTAPILAAIGNKTINEESLLTFTVTAIDADIPANTLIYSLVGAPTGASINAVTGVFTWTPQVPGSYPFTIRVSDGVLTDEEQITVTVNTITRPTATIEIYDTMLAIGDTTQVTFIFSEAVTGFTSTDVFVANGTLSDLVTTDGGVTWTATLTPEANIADATNLLILNNAGVQNAAGHTGSGTTTSRNYAIDTVRPTAMIVVTDTILTADETSPVTITFSEAVTGLSIADFTVANGNLSNLSTVDNITYTATLTPATNTTAATNVIALDNTAFQDMAGNTGEGTLISNNYAIDTVRPTATIVVTDTMLTANETTTVTITFSQAVTGLSVADFTVANGTLSSPTTVDGGITWTATLTPAPNTADTTNLIILDNTGVQNAAGNTGLGTTTSNNYAIDTTTQTVVRPTAIIVVTKPMLKAGETSPVTLTFSEAITGLDYGDITVANGTLSNLSTTNNSTYTATLTPTANTRATTNVITLDNTGIQNMAGNTGLGTTASNAYAIDTVRPTVTIVVADTMLTAGETSLVTFTFSEEVTGFDNADLIVENGILSALQTSDHRIWTAIFTPQAAINITNNVIKLDASGVTNQAGNAGQGITASNPFSISTRVTTGSGNANHTPNHEVPPIVTDTVVTSKNGKLKLPIGTAGIVSLGEKIEISIPKDAAKQELDISIEELTEIETLLEHGKILASPIFELRKNSSEPFSKPVTLSILFDSSYETVGLFYYDDVNNVWLQVEDTRIKDNQLTAEVKAFYKYAIMAVDPPTATEIPTATPDREHHFPDTGGHWAQASIAAMYKNGIIQGYEDGTFRPDHSITREHMAVMLARALTLPPVRPALPFHDVAVDSPYYDAIYQLQTAGIIDGANGAFHPQAAMTRAELAKVLVLALGYESDGNTTFQDVPNTHWAHNYIAALEQQGIALGDQGKFKPNAPVTRAEFATFLYRAFKQ